MRVLVLLCVGLCGCFYESNYYGAPGADGGVTDMSGYTDQYGDYHEDPNLGVFKSDSKLQGFATLALQEPPLQTAAAGPNPAWPFVRNTPAVSGGQTLLDLRTIDGLPYVVSVSMGINGDQLTSQIGGHTEVVALINMGVGGLPVQAEVDVVQGVQFSLAVSQLQAHLVYRAVPGGAVVPTPIPQYNAGAAVASGTIAHGRQPQRTLAKGGTGVVPGLVAGATEYWIIPAFAKSLRVIAQPNNSQLMIRIFPVLFVGNACAQYAVVAAPSGDLPIPSDGYFISVNNTSAQDNIQNYRLIFELAL